MIDELQLYALLRDAAATNDELEWHVDLRALVLGWTRRLASAGVSLDAARAEIEARTSPVLAEARADRVTPARIREVQRTIGQWIVEDFEQIARTSHPTPEH